MSDIPFPSGLSSIIGKTSATSTQSFKSMNSIINILFNKELYCDKFYEEALEFLEALKAKHCNGCKCNLGRPSEFQIIDIYSSYYERMELFRESIPDIAQSKKVYIQPGPDGAQENDQLDFNVNYRGTLQDATIKVENIGSQNYEMNFSFKKEEGFALAWMQIVARREDAEELCKQIQTLEGLQLDNQSPVENWKKLIEAMEEKVFYNSLEKSIEIKAEKNQVNDDILKGVLGTLSRKKSNLYLSLDLSDNPEITNDIIPRLYDCLKNWQSKGFSYLLLHLNNTSVDLDFIDTLCERMPISLKGLWLDVQHLTIDEKRNTRLLNFLKTHHSYMEFFVINIKCEKEKENENQRRIHNIHKIKDRLKLFSMIGNVSEKLKHKVMQSFSNFGGGKLEIEFSNPNTEKTNISDINKHISFDSVGMQKQQSNGYLQSTSTEAGTNPTAKNVEQDLFQAVNSFSVHQNTGNKSLESNFDPLGLKILSENHIAEPVTDVNTQSVEENSIQGLNDTVDHR